MSAVSVTWAWPLARAGEGVAALARHAGLRPAEAEPAVAPEAIELYGTEALGEWIEWSAQRLGIEAEPVDTPVSDVAALLGAGGPAIVRSNTPDGPRLWLLLGCKSGVLRLLGPDLCVHRCSREALRALLCAPYEAPWLAEIEGLLDLAEIPARRRDKVRSALLRERLGAVRLGGCWILRTPPEAAFWRQLAQARLPARVVGILLAFAAMYALEILGWSLIGEGALGGRLDPGWLIAWLLLVLSLIPLQWLGNWLEGTFALDAGRLLKQRLLAGALRMDLESLRHQGAGQLLGRVIESQALESLALNGGLGVLIALLELAFAAWVLAMGAGGRWHVGLLFAWLAVTLGLAWRYYRRLGRWTGARLDLTHDLVERMVGHRTCLAQEPPGLRDAREDHAMENYLGVSKAMDGALVPAAGLVPRGWLILGLVGLMPAFVSGSAAPPALAIALGGMLLAHRALAGVAGGLAALGRAAVAWRQVAPLFLAASQVPPSPLFPMLASGIRPERGAQAAPLIDASDLVFRYDPLGEPVLRRADLSIRHGERVLLEGRSGGGKSTLAALLVGLRSPQSGLLLLNGLDRHTLGEAWHKLATGAPQFHENHILTGTLAFNLLMGRQWPPSDADLTAAEALCVELGLGDLLQRMPAGIMQMVGETGWQLSHGERSRVYLARALLQQAPLTVLDESFAALDPETLHTCLRCALDRADTLLVIAHP